ncbi:MAG: MarR family transcriptional regulator [Proteobacteria bacterium]|nr:MarR family transcriptional regulator [Pseudomonadota bacterium]
MDLIDPRDCPYYLLSRVTLSVTSAMKKGFDAAGVSEVKPAYLGALMSLWAEDGLQVAELGRRAGLEPSTMTGLLDRMERDGLVERRQDPDDRRAQRILLTSQGRTIRPLVLEQVDRILGEVFTGVSKEEMDQATAFLRRVLENAQEKNPR